MHRLKRFVRNVGTFYLVQLAVCGYLIGVYFLNHLRHGILILTLPCFLLPFAWIYPLRNFLVERFRTVVLIVNISVILLFASFYYGQNFLPKHIGIAMLYCLLVGSLFATQFWIYSDPAVERE